jgi:hypothetical protein
MGTASSLGVRGLQGSFCFIKSLLACKQCSLTTSRKYTDVMVCDGVATAVGGRISQLPRVASLAIIDRPTGAPGTHIACVFSSPAGVYSGGNSNVWSV